MEVKHNISFDVIIEEPKSVLTEDKKLNMEHNWNYLFEYGSNKDKNNNIVRKKIVEYFKKISNFEISKIIDYDIINAKLIQTETYEEYITIKLDVTLTINHLKLKREIKENEKKNKLCKEYKSRAT